MKREISEGIKNRHADLLKISGQLKVPYIIGGVGPAAQIPFQSMLLSARPDANGDQQHIGYLLECQTPFPDRTAALLARDTGDSTSYNEVKRRLLASATFAGANGFDFMVALCNTMHAWREPLDKELPIPWISLMGSVAEELRKFHAVGTKVGVLSTTGTLRQGLYAAALREVGFVPVAPEADSKLQTDVMAAIYDSTFGVKATGDTVSDQSVALLSTAADELVGRGAVVIVGGCTEIPLALNRKTYKNVPVVDPLVSLATVVVNRAMGSNT